MHSENISEDGKLKQVKSKFGFENIKNDFILKKIFDNMKKNKILKLIKCNGKIQQRLNLTIHDYNKYSQLYSSIEIELKII